MRPSSENPTVAIITVSYGSEESLPALLDSVNASSRIAPSVVVVDNKPAADVARIASSYGARYVELAENPGYGGAMNAGSRAIPDSVAWMLIVNPDVVLEPGALDAMVAAGEASPDVAAVGPAILTPEGRLYPSARRVPSLRIGVGHALFSGAWPDNPWSKQYRVDDQPYQRDAGWLSGACLLVRRVAFESVGGFDPRFFMYFEDVDLGMRLGREGWRNLYVPEVHVTHVGAHSTSHSRSAMVHAHHASANLFLAKKYPGLPWAPVRLALRVGLAARSRLSRLRAPRRSID